MKLLKVLQNILEHPLNQQHKFAAIARFGRWQLGTRLLNAPVAVDFVNDSKLLVWPGMTGATGNVYCGLHEFEEMSFLLHLLRPEDTFVDVGANVGSYTVLAGAAVGCHCHAIEPNPQAFNYLLDNIALNHVAERVEAHNVGVASTEGHLRFSSSQGTMNHVIVDGMHVEESVEVVVKTLDVIVGQDKPTALKIDVEGFETAVIKGAQRLLAEKTLLAVIMEQNSSGKQFGFDEGALHRHMTETHGFQAMRYDPFTRELRHSELDHETDNRIYIRETEHVMARLQSARQYTVLDRTI